MTRFDSQDAIRPEDDDVRSVPGDPEEDGPAFDPADLEVGDDDDDEEEAEEGAEKAPKEEEEPERDPPPPVPTKKKIADAMNAAFEGQEFLEEGLVDRYTEHAMLLLKENQKVNLTAITDPEEMAAKHYFDSWYLALMMPLMGRRVLDLGTGAGFPGIPLALAEDAAKFTVCDSTEKKITFVQSCIDKMKIKNATAVCERAEDHLVKQSYDVVLVRAVSSVRENVRLLRKVRHSLKDFVMFKGASWSREVRAGEREAERLGFSLDTVWEYELPNEMGKRAILVYRAPGGQGV